MAEDYRGTGWSRIAGAFGIITLAFVAGSVAVIALTPPDSGLRFAGAIGLLIGLAVTVYRVVTSEALYEGVVRFE